MNLLGNEEDIDFKINLQIAEALAALKNLNAEAGSFPEVIANTNAALQEMTNKTGLSLGAVEKKFKEVGAAAEQLQARLALQAERLGVSYEEFVKMSGLSTHPALIAGQPFGDLGATAGYKAAADARRESATLAKEEERSAAAIAADLNTQAAEEAKITKAEAQRLRTNLALEAQVEKQVALNQELNKLQKSSLNRDARGRFSGGRTPTFISQFGDLGDYQKQLKFVESTISSLAAKTGMSFKDVGANLQKTFPELLKDTNLVTTAVQNLINANQGLSASFKTEAEAVAAVRGQLTTMQAQGRLNLTGTPNDQVNQLKSIIREVSASTGAQYKQVATQLEAIGVPAAKAQAAVKGLNNEMLKGTKSAQGLGHSIDLVRTALGTLVAVGVFNFMQAFQNGISEIIRTLRELEVGIYNLTNAERVLSEQGIDIAPKDLDETIKKLQQLDPLLSRIEATELVSRVARNVAPAVGFNKKQIDELSQSVAVFAIRNKALGYSFEEVEKMMTEAFTTGKVSQGINKLGIKIDDQIVKDEALRMGLVESADAFDKLTGKQEANVKAAAMLSLVYQNAQKEISHLPDYLKTADAAFGIFQARLTDVFTKLGEKLGPVLAQVLEGFATALQGFLDYLNRNDEAVQHLALGFSLLGKGIVWVVSTFFKLIEALGSLGTAFDKFLRKFPGVQKAIDKLFGGATAKDTPTSPFSGMADKAAEDAAKVIDATKEAQDKISDIMQDAADKRADIERQYQQKLADIALDNQRKLEDIARETAQKQADAQRNYEQKVEDINRDANEKIAEANADARQREVDREKEFQERLRELREKFLLDLEDALHERDARQVLRLIRQYNLDKKNLEERHKLDAQQSKKDLAQKLADIERDRQLKLQAAQRELAEKNAEIQLWAQRERQDAQIALQRKLADARLWHQRELQDYQQFLQRKLQELAKAIVKEYQLTAAGAQAIYNLLNGYYGASGSIPNLLANGLAGSLNGVLSSSSTGISGNPLASPSWAQAGFFGAAEGGTFIATRPTKMLVGESGMEQVSVTPLGRTGTDVNKVFTNAGVGGGSMGGSLNLRVSISDGLVAEIIDTSLDNVAATIEKIRREK